MPTINFNIKINNYNKWKRKFTCKRSNHRINESIRIVPFRTNFGGACHPIIIIDQCIIGRVTIRFIFDRIVDWLLSKQRFKYHTPYPKNWIKFKIYAINLNSSNG